jgi:hypothetical protein
MEDGFTERDMKRDMDRDMKRDIDRDMKREMESLANWKI